jgi:hypothetical protein
MGLIIKVENFEEMQQYIAIVKNKIIEESQNIQLDLIGLYSNIFSMMDAVPHNKRMYH